MLLAKTSFKRLLYPKLERVCRFRFQQTGYLSVPARHLVRLLLLTNAPVHLFASTITRELLPALWVLCTDCSRSQKSAFALLCVAALIPVRRRIRPCTDFTDRIRRLPPPFPTLTCLNSALGCDAISTSARQGLYLTDSNCGPFRLVARRLGLAQTAAGQAVRPAN